MKKLAVRILMTYLLLVLLFTGLLTSSFLIPRQAIEPQVRQSVAQLIEDGDRYDHVSIGMVTPWMLGDFSDCLMLGIAYCADSSKPLSSAMSAVFPMKDGSPIEGARLTLEAGGDSGDSGEGVHPVIYSRYWHGNQVVLRPLLALTTVRGIYGLNIVLLTLLWMLMTAALWRRTGPGNALIIMLCLAAAMIPSVPLCMNYVPTFYIAMTASLLILTWRRCTATPGDAVLLFFVIGAFTTYLDLLTTPMIAMAVPLLVYMLYRRPTHSWRAVIVLALAWLLGYALLWATKWLLAVLVIGPGAVQDAMGAVTQRTVGHDEGDYMLWCLKWTLAALAGTAVLTLFASLLLGGTRQALRRHGWLLLVALSSFVWTLVLLEHTWHHLHFTWRTFTVAAIGIMLYLYHQKMPSKGRFF